MTVSVPDTITPGGPFPVAMATDIGDTPDKVMMTATERANLGQVVPAVTGLNAKVISGGVNLWQLSGVSSVIPIAVDAANTIMLGIDKATGGIVSRFAPRLGNFGAAARSAVGEADLGLWKVVGNGPSVHPLVADSAGTVVAGIDRATGGLIARFSTKLGNFAAVARAAVAETSLGLWSFTGAGATIPIIVGPKNEILLGYDNAKTRAVGMFAPPILRSAGVPLAAADMPILADWNGLLVDSQSLGIGTDSGAVVTPAQPFANITFAGGPRAGATDAGASITATAPLVETLVGTNGETPCSGAALRASEQALNESGIDPAKFVIFAFTGGYGSRAISELGKGTSRYNAFKGQIQAAKNLATAAGKSFAVHAICWIQGEDGEKDYAFYYNALKQLRLDLETDIKAITGQTHPVAVLLYQTEVGSIVGNDNTGTRGSVCRAQFDLCRFEPHFYFVTPITHLPQSLAPGNIIHRTSVGYRLLGEYFGRAYKELVIDKIVPRALLPAGAIARTFGGVSVVRLRFKVPVKPIMPDQVNLRAVKDYGFAIFDDAGQLTLGNPQVENGDTLVWTLNRQLAANPYVRAGMDNFGAGQGLAYAGNVALRDSSPETTVIGGVEYPLWRVCPAFSISISVLS